MYAEVKRFCWKILDGLNQVAMFGATAGVLVRLEDPTETEGKSAWERIADGAVRKAPQYGDRTANILVVESDSECLELMTASAAHEYDNRASEASSDSPLRTAASCRQTEAGQASVPTTVMWSFVECNTVLYP